MTHPEKALVRPADYNARVFAPADRGFLRRYAWLSIGAAVTTMALKAAAYLLTGSVGLLSDAVESIVNLVGASMALWMLTVAARAEDEDHAYGHSKAEYFSSGAEGSLIVIAAISIAVAAVQRLIEPRPIEGLGVGLAVSLSASLVNLVVALVIRAAGHRHQSITLRANAEHLFTDVWTSGGVLVALGAVYVTGWDRLDPVVGLAVAANIAVAGLRIVRDSVHGLMDTALPAEDRERVQGILDALERDGIQYHALRTRQSGARQFVSVHVLVPGDWTVQRGHDLLERVEADIRAALPAVTVFTHLEPLHDPVSFEDQHLDRRPQVH
mgnify:CR=1 FL=1